MKQKSSRKQSKWLKRLSQQSTAMYSFDGAAFQESALARLDYAHSFAHASIGRLVNQINRGDIDRDLAEVIYSNLLEE